MERSHWLLVSILSRSAPSAMVHCRKVSLLLSRRLTMKTTFGIALLLILYAGGGTPAHAVCAGTRSC